jgi:hypothetical protein
MFRQLLALFLFFSVSTFAAESGVLTIDKSVAAELHLSFPNDSNVQPTMGDFKVINFILMSNEVGDRWAVVTVKNESSGNRTLNQSHLLGLFANGERFHPLEFKQSFDGYESASLTITFGEHKFPIIELYSRRNI